MPNDPVDRRTVLRGAGALGAGVVGVSALAACSSSTPATSTPAAPATTAAAAGVTVKSADVPVGGGVILKEQKVVVTQPTAGQYKAFTAVCTHKGCTVAKVADGHIGCPCHGSQFDIATGAPTAASPAKAPLASKTATLSGDTITVA